MKVKKFQGTTIADTMRLVGKEMGPEALILSTEKKHRLNDENDYQEYFEISAMAGPDQENEVLETTSNTNLSKDTIKTLRSELMSIKEMMFILDRSRMLTDSFRSVPGAINIFGRLIRSGINEFNARRFLENSGIFNDEVIFSPKDVRKQVLKEILKEIEVCDPFDTDQQVIAAFIGSTGVGKTTTVAKIAANEFLLKKKSVGFISIDNYRIAALDQLKTYASILGIPCLPAFNQKELAFALNRMKDKDIILIDTAGQSHYDYDRIHEMQELIGNRPITKHLLISAGIHESEITRVAKNFKKLDYSTYIFTKTDETRQRGVIINQLIAQKMPISFITTGQRVPEDIMTPTKMDVLRLLF
ncbi:flagellar biosynthesis protein FlhF [Candidatus Magnetomorum sp. HK-1]|nr:flagellar biosynthesis protein FlhF [Candidatus Magnetomorum sp. HK-1]